MESQNDTYDAGINSVVYRLKKPDRECIIYDYVYCFMEVITWAHAKRGAGLADIFINVAPGVLFHLVISLP